jgi:putative spermidine/putrescine transport system substrate-binding protein
MAAGSLIGSRPAAAQPQGFVLGTFGGIFETALKEMGPELAKAGLAPELSVGGSQLTLTKLQAGRERSPFDAVMMTAEAMLIAHQRGLLATVTPADLPNLTRVQQRLLEPFKVNGGYASTPLHWKAIGILWRKDLVPFEITSWQDLWRPELKGRISVQNMPTLGAASMLIAAAVINGGSQKNLEPGWKAMRALRPNIREFYSISSNALTSLVAGDTWVSVNVADLGLPLASRNVATTVPKEGAPYSPEGLGYPRYAANPAAARSFGNFMLSEAAQRTWCGQAKVAPATAVELDAAARSQIVEDEAILSKLMEIDFLDMGNSIRGWADRWRQEVVG